VEVTTLGVSLSRLILLAALVGLAACGRPSVEGIYRDVDNSSLRYEIRPDGLWSAELVVEVPSGVFPHGASRRFLGTFVRRGDILELVCTSSDRQDPMSGEFRPEDCDLSAHHHRLRAQDGALVAVGADGQTESLFATDLNPFGARRLERETSP